MGGKWPCSGPWENVTYEFVLASPACLARLTWMVLWARREVAVLLLFCCVLLPGFVQNKMYSSHIAFLQVLRPCRNNDMSSAWKNFLFISSETEKERKMKSKKKNKYRNLSFFYEYSSLSHHAICTDIPDHLSPPLPTVDCFWQGYILYWHRAVVCSFELVVLLLLVHVKGSTGVHHLWAHPYFSSSVLHVWFF